MKLRKLIQTSSRMVCDDACITNGTRGHMVRVHLSQHLTKAWSRRLPAYAPASLRLSDAAEAQRYRAKKAWRLLQGASPCRVRASHPPVASLASMAESGAHTRRTRGTKRRPRLLEAAGGAVSPAGLGQLRNGAWCGRRGCERTPQAIQDSPHGQGEEGPPESSGRGRQAERRSRTWEAPTFL
jgi:hypothetical protein